MENTGFKVSSVLFILYIYQMNKVMKEKNQVVPDEVLSKEFLNQFKTEADVSKFLKQLHAQVLEKMLEGEIRCFSSLLRFSPSAAAMRPTLIRVMPRAFPISEKEHS